MAYKCKILEAVNLTLHGALVFCIYTHICTTLKDIGINKENEICLIKQGIHKWS